MIGTEKTERTESVRFGPGHSGTEKTGRNGGFFRTPVRRSGPDPSPGLPCSEEASRIRSPVTRLRN